jgi:hypothetical protein
MDWYNMGPSILPESPKDLKESGSRISPRGFSNRPIELVPDSLDNQRAMTSIAEEMVAAGGIVPNCLQKAKN